MNHRQARALWHRLETIHAVTYFADECREANKAVGLRGFWMGYFGSRAAPLGPVPAAVVVATFFNFHPAMVRRAIPDAWSFASPDAIIEARRDAAAAALRRAAPQIEDVAGDVITPLRAAIERTRSAGRPLFEANRGITPTGNAAADLWQVATCLREHRGDGHVAALVAAGLDGCEAHVLAAAVNGTPVETLRDNRGWSDEDWLAATRRLHVRGWLDADAAITPDGARAHADLEMTTDARAAEPFALLDDPVHVFARLDEAARAIVAGGIIPFPNPMGLPRDWVPWTG